MVGQFGGQTVLEMHSKPENFVDVLYGSPKIRMRGGGRGSKSCLILQTNNTDRLREI